MQLFFQHFIVPWMIQDIEHSFSVNVLSQQKAHNIPKTCSYCIWGCTSPWREMFNQQSQFLVSEIFPSFPHWCIYSFFVVFNMENSDAILPFIKWCFWPKCYCAAVSQTPKYIQLEKLLNLQYFFLPSCNQFIQHFMVTHVGFFFINLFIYLLILGSIGSLLLPEGFF